MHPFSPPIRQSSVSPGLTAKLTKRCINAKKTKRHPSTRGGFFHRRQPGISWRGTRLLPFLPVHEHPLIRYLHRLFSLLYALGEKKQRRTAYCVALALYFRRNPQTKKGHETFRNNPKKTFVALISVFCKNPLPSFFGRIFHAFIACLCERSLNLCERGFLNHILSELSISFENEPVVAPNLLLSGMDFRLLFGSSPGLTLLIRRAAKDLPDIRTCPVRNYKQLP